MGRDPNHGAAFVFDLVDDDPVDDDAVDPDAPTIRAGAERPDDANGAVTLEREQAPPGSQNERWRPLVPVAVVIAIVLGAGMAFDGARDHVRMERMRDVPGGVTDVSSPLDEVWAWDGDVDRNEGTTDVAVLGGALVFESDGELVALEPATGEEAWTVPLGVDPDCGPMVSAVWQDPTTPSLVCLQGTAAEREVVVVGPGGVVSTPRRLDAADVREHGLPHTGPAGTVLRGKRVGPASVVDVSGVRCEGSEGCTGTVESGRDLVLRAEDAVTGAERWSVTIPFRATDAMLCNRMFDPAWGRSVYSVQLTGALVLDAFGARVTADLVSLAGCGIGAAITPDGVRLGTQSGPGTGLVTPLAEGGGYIGTNFDGVARTTVYDGEGAAVAKLTGYAIAPWATDKSGPATLLALDELGRRLRAYEADATPRWDVALQSGSQDFLAQVGETAVITGAGTVRGLDLATGEGRWTWDGSDAEPERDGGYFGSADVVQTFTDGESVLLLTAGDSGSALGMVALDVASGGVVWERPAGGPVTTFDPRSGDAVERGVSGDLVAVDGNLMEVTSTGVRGLG